MELLAREARRRKERRKQEGIKGGEKGDGEKPPPEREWVLPTQVREKWSLRRFGEVFEGIEVVPPEPADSEPVVSGEKTQEEKAKDDADDDTGATDSRRSETETEGATSQPARNKWRTLKRVVLATLDDDSTIVYYIVHDGIVKPRQN